jgi:hypothetical protein
VGRAREYITEECCNRTDRRLPSGTIDSPIHLCEKSNRNGCADDSAYRGAEYVLETERGENISTRHYEKAGEPRPSKLFSSGASKPTRAQTGLMRKPGYGSRPAEPSREQRRAALAWKQRFDPRASTGNGEEITPATSPLAKAMTAARSPV